MAEGTPPSERTWIDTFRQRSCVDLLSRWQRCDPLSPGQNALEHPWAARHRPDCAARGLIAWPRGRRAIDLVAQLDCPPLWLGRNGAEVRLDLRWWAESAAVRIDGVLVHRGDLFDNGCRWRLPARWLDGDPLEVLLELVSPGHDDGALVRSVLVIEPGCGDRDPQRWLVPDRLGVHLALEGSLPLSLLATDPLSPEALKGAETVLQGEPAPPAGLVHLMGHAHLDLAWLWPLAETWQAALRTFRSVLALMESFPELHFGHSTPALYAWLERHHPALLDRIQRASRSGRWEPLNGPWVETDAVLPGTASLLRQCQEGQVLSQRLFPEWSHHLAWLPDSFGFSAGVPSLFPTAGIRWFCTHKLTWNETQPFPHRLFRWRGRCGSQCMALMLPPIGTDGDPLAIAAEQKAWGVATGLGTALWLPGLGDHGGGPTAEMLDQIRLWSQVQEVTPRRHGTVRDFLGELEPLEPSLPVWRDELYLELHRGCATTRPDQKRHNRSLERLLREAELAVALAGTEARGLQSAWHTLMLHQFHDILPGTSIAAVFEQAEPAWRRARRQARIARDEALRSWLDGQPSARALDRAHPVARGPYASEIWSVVSLQPQPSMPTTLRLPAGVWRCRGSPLPQQPSRSGGTWVQIPRPEGVSALQLTRSWERSRGDDPSDRPINPVALERDERTGCWRLSNGMLRARLGSAGVEALQDRSGTERLSGPLELTRWRDRGAFWDAWDIAPPDRRQRLPLEMTSAAEVLEAGSLCTHLLWRGSCGGSPWRLEVRLQAASPWLELILSVDWRQRHELLRLECPLAQPAARWAADAPAAVLERPAVALTPRERSRWEVTALSWLAAQARLLSGGGGLAVLLDGPQGVSGSAERLGVSLLRGPTWPDPGGDCGWHRLRLGLVPLQKGWHQERVVEAAQRFREPLWRGPLRSGKFTCPTREDCGEPNRRVLAPLPPGVVLVALQPWSGSMTCPVEPGCADNSSDALILSLQNCSPARRSIALGDGWQLVSAANALAEPLNQPGSGEEEYEPCHRGGLELRPWQLGHWLIRPST